MTPHIPRTSRPAGRRGMALPIVLMAIVVLAAMVAGAAYFAMQNGRAADNSRRFQRNFGTAEAAMAEVINGWNPNTYNLMTKGSSVAIAQTTTPIAGGIYAGNVRKLSDKTFMVDLTAYDTTGENARGGGARQRIGTMVRIIPLGIDIQSALTTLGPINFGGGNVFTEGNDQVPTGYPAGVCPPTGAAVGGVRTQKIGDLPSSNGQYHGAPDALVSPSMTTAVLDSFGTTTFAAAAANRNIKIVPGTYTINPTPNTVAGPCVFSNTNWGDGASPNNACGSYYPIVYDSGAGTTTISSGQGQGLLLVDGNLAITGAFTFYGVVVVKGTISTVGGASPKFYGAVLAGGLNFSSTSGSGSAYINYSSCTIDRMMNATGKVTPMRSRGYVRLQ